MFHGGSKKTLKKRYYSVKQKIKLKKRFVLKEKRRKGERNREKER